MPEQSVSRIAALKAGQLSPLLRQYGAQALLQCQLGPPCTPQWDKNRSL